MNSLYAKRILVVDDEVAIAQMIRIILEKEGWTNITVVHTYQEAKDAIQRGAFDLYLLDIMLPDGSGLDLATVAREKGNAPIFFLTALTSDADVLTGFMQGADDYIKKPFNPLELAARVNAQMKRYVGQHDGNARIRFGNCTLDTKAALLLVENQEVELTGKQYQLLAFFATHLDQVLSKEQLYEAVWQEEYIDDNTIMVHIRKLREKIEDNPSDPQLLVTMRGIGYKLKREA